MTAKDRTAFTAGLRAVADWLDAHPEVPLPCLGFGGLTGNDKPTMDIYVHDDEKAAMAVIARAMGTANKQAKEWKNGTASFMLWREFNGIVVCANAPRDQVCTRVVTGTEDREVEEVVTPAVTRKVTKPVETVEWRCEPLLATPASVLTESAIENDPDGVAEAVTAALAADEPVTCRACQVTAPQSQMRVVHAEQPDDDPELLWYCADLLLCNARRRPQMMTQLQAQHALVSRLAEDEPEQRRYRAVEVRRLLNGGDRP